MAGETTLDQLASADHDHPTVVNYVELSPTAGEGRGRSSSSTGSSGCWRNWLENLPYFARAHRAIALDLPGFGDSPMPSWEISMAKLRAADPRLLRAVGIGRRRSSATRWAASSRRGGDRAAGAVRAAGAGLRGGHQQRPGARRPARRPPRRMATGAAPLLCGSSEPAMLRPRLRQAPSSGLFQHPEQLRTELLPSSSHNGTGRPGFLPRVQGLIGYDILERSTTSRCRP